MFRGRPQTTSPYEGTTVAFPASAPSAISPFPLSGTESLIPLLPLLPPPGKKKKKAPTPQGGAADSSGRGKWEEEESRDHQGGGLQIPGRAGGYREERGSEGSGRSCPLPPLPTVQGASTQPRGQVCVGSGLIGERSRRNKSLKPSEFPLRNISFSFPSGGSLVGGEVVRSW